MACAAPLLIGLEGLALFGTVSGLAGTKVVPVDQGGIEVGAVDASELGHAAHLDAAAAAHAGAGHHDGVERRGDGGVVLLGGEGRELHHRNGADAEDLAHGLVLQQALQRSGDNALLAVGTVVSGDVDVSTGVFVIYDELEGKEAVTWSYLLHTVELPMEIQELTDEVKVTGRNKAGGISVAHLFSSAKTEQAMVDTFFCAPTNWKNVTNAQGKAVKYPNHWHFSSTTVPCKTARFLTVMDTHGDNRPDMQVVRKGNIIQVGDWTITCNLTEKGKAAIHVSNKVEKVSLNYDAGKKEGATTVTDQVKGKQVNKVLTDYLPDFEI